MGNKKLLNTREAAKSIGISYGSLVKLRYHSNGPSYVRIGVGKGKIYYCECDLDAWIDGKRLNCNLNKFTCSVGSFNSDIIQKILNSPPDYPTSELEVFFKRCYECESFFNCKLSITLGVKVAIGGMGKDKKWA